MQNDKPVDTMTLLKQLSDDALVARLERLVARERQATAELVAHLAELEGRGLPANAPGPSEHEADDGSGPPAPRGEPR
jgi:hypothetical protein